MTWRMRSTISSWKISRCSMLRWRASWGVMGMALVGDWGLGIGDSGFGIRDSGFGRWSLLIVIPAEAGTQCLRLPKSQSRWVPAFAGMTAPEAMPAHASPLQQILQQRMPMPCKDRLGIELHAFHRVFEVSQIRGAAGRGKGGKDV